MNTRLKKILFITGAGISKASGLPTFYGPGGLYENSVDISSLLTLAMFKTCPAIVWNCLRKLYVGKFQPQHQSRLDFSHLSIV